MAKTNRDLILSGVGSLLSSQNMDVANVQKNVLDAILDAYEVLEKMMWAKLSDKNILNFVKSWNEQLEIITKILEKHTKTDVIYTFRQTYMNNKTKKVLVNKANILTYLKNVADNQVVMLKKPVKQPKVKTAKVAKPVISTVSSFAQAIGEQKPAIEKTKPEFTWVEKTVKEMTAKKFYKINTKDGKHQYFGRLYQTTTATISLRHYNFIRILKISDINAKGCIYEYVLKA